MTSCKFSLFSFFFFHCTFSISTVCIKIGFCRFASLGFCREDGQNVNNTYFNQFQNLHFHSPNEKRYSWAIKWNSTSPQLGFLESLQWVRTSEIRFLGSIHPSIHGLFSKQPWGSKLGRTESKILRFGVFRV